MPHTLTVVIPALNEAEGLARLLGQLASQTRVPDQVVVADAHSTDATREIAEQLGATVVDGGMPAVGRNAGAAVATSELLLFLDADVDLDPTFIEEAVAEFFERELTIAGARIEPLEREPGNLFACEVANFYLEAMQYVSPHAPGFCMLTRKETHDAIDGFDEEVLLAEDHDYAQRAAELGKFRILRCMPVRTSMRRIEKEGILQLAFKYVYCELHVVAGPEDLQRPVRLRVRLVRREGPREVAAGGRRVARASRRVRTDAPTLLGREPGRAVAARPGANASPERFEAALAKVGRRRPQAAAALRRRRA